MRPSPASRQARFNSDFARHPDVSVWRRDSSIISYVFIFYRMIRMLRSIATVSLGGTLMEKLNAIAAAGFDGVEIFENDLLYFDGSPAEVKRIAARSRPAHPAVPAVPRFRGGAARPHGEEPRPRRTQVRRDGAARRRPDAGAAATSRPTRSTTTRGGRRPARARRARRAARLPHRLRGAGLGPPRQHVRPRLEARAGGGPSGGRPGGGQLPHLRDRGRRRADRQASPATASSSRSLPTRR